MSVIIQIPITIFLSFLVDVGLSFQMQLIFSITRRRSFVFSYSFGPWKKLFLQSCCLIIFNVGLLVKSLPDRVLGPLLIFFLVSYALSAIVVASNKVGRSAINER